MALSYLIEYVLKYRNNNMNLVLEQPHDGQSFQQHLQVGGYGNILNLENFGK